MSRSRVSPARAGRERFRRRRARAFTASALVLLALAAVGCLLVAPGHLASVRLYGVSLGWWATLAAYALGLIVLGLWLAGRAERPSPP